LSIQKTSTVAAVTFVGALLATSCAALAPAPDYDALAAQMIAGSFRDEGIAKVERLRQDEANAACSKALGGNPPEDVARAIQQAALASVRMPAEGKFIGDWRAGEKLAQNGRGMTWSDPSTATQANGGNCYNCHQITKEEISYGTIGPSLYRFGRTRGYTDETRKYVYAKVFNAQAFNACSNMPRFGYKGILTEQQIKDVTALLLDPDSPVNR
jgi:sulfur-oxidizing protein SoxX